jgi:hypothetical protein
MPAACCRCSPRCASPPGALAAALVECSASDLI